MSQTQEKNRSENLEKLISEIEDDSDESDDNTSDDSRAYFSMALSVIVTSIMLQMIPILSGFLVGISLWFVMALVISNTLKLVGWTEESKTDELDDFEILQMAYKRGLITEEQLEESLNPDIEYNVD